MAEIEDLEKKRALTRRLALLALIGERPEPTGSCLDAEELAALVEGRLAAAQIEACLDHLAGCEHCYATWRQLDEDWQLRTRDSARNRLHRLIGRPRFLAAAGTLLAAAASIAVFLNITMEADRRTLMRPPVTSSREQVLTEPRPDAANQARPEKESSAPTPSVSMGGKATEPESAAPFAQPAEPSRKKARPERVEPGKQEAPKPVQPPALAPRQEMKTMRVPAATGPAVAEPERTTADEMREEKEPAAKRVDRAVESVPVPPPAVMPSPTKEAVSLHAPVAGTAPPPTMATWRNHIREGCQGHPGAGFFEVIARQGQQLLAQSAPLEPHEQRQVEQILTLLRNRQAGEQLCRELLERLEPVELDHKP